MKKEPLLVELTASEKKEAIISMLDDLGGDIDNVSETLLIYKQYGTIFKINRYNFVMLSDSLVDYLAYKKVSDNYIGKLTKLVRYVGQKNFYNAVVVNKDYARTKDMMEIIDFKSTSFSVFLREMSKLNILKTIYIKEKRREIFCFNPYVIGKGANYFPNITDGFIDLRKEGNWDLQK